MTRPADLQWQGGKWPGSAVNRFIRSALPETAVYVEPYCGMAGVLMSRPRSAREVIGDLDDELILWLRTVQAPGSEAAGLITEHVDDRVWQRTIADEEVLEKVPRVVQRRESRSPPVPRGGAGRSAPCRLVVRPAEEDALRCAVPPLDGVTVADQEAMIAEIESEIWQAVHDGEFDGVPASTLPNSGPDAGCGRAAAAGSARSSGGRHPASTVCA